MKKLLVMFFLLPGLAPAGPAINIGSLHDYLEGPRSTVLKRVRNTGDTTAFVKVSVVELKYDAQGQSHEVAMDGQPAGDRALVASPARLIVPAGGMQAVRLLYRGERAQERYFRLRFIPVLPETDDGFAVSDEEAKRYNSELQAGVNILAGYGSIFFVRPEHTLFATQVLQQPGHFKVVNGGNSTVVLDHFRDCNTAGTQCEVATQHHLLPGVGKTFDKRAGRTYRFDVIEADATRKVEVNG